ncbi:hypothetical protein D3C73_1111040 [compost metagenome]
MIGLSWLGKLYTFNLPALSTARNAQPEPKRVVAAAAKSALNLSKPPSSAVIASAKAPVGAPPASGPIVSQNREWLACPPPLLRTAVRISSGRLFKSPIKSLSDLS